MWWWWRLFSGVGQSQLATLYFYLFLARVLYLKPKEMLSNYESVQHLSEDFHSFRKYLSVCVWSVNSARPWGEGWVDYKVKEPHPRP